jgi:hypothetical protein
MNALLAQNAGDAGSVAVGFGILWIVMALLAIVSFGVWLWALIDAIQNPTLTGTARLMWILIIVFTHFIGAILYLIIGRSGGTPRSV